MTKMMESNRFPRHKNIFRGKRFIIKEAVTKQEQAKRFLQKSRSGIVKGWGGFQKYQNAMREKMPGLDPHSDKFVYKNQRKRK